MGSAHPHNAPYQAFETKDGWITLGAANQANWLRLLDVIEAPRLASDPRFVDNAARMKNRGELEQELNAVFRQRTKDDWLARLDEAGVPAGPVLDVCDMHRNEQVLAREMVVETQHTTLGPVKTIGFPVKFSKTPGGVKHSAPVYGEHTREVLAEYGFSDADIAALVEERAVILAEGLETAR
jgi:crotonobetainyl-CoA:carnitine CoA-transferase CaiB-like acyl-CoA transferase